MTKAKKNPQGKLPYSLDIVIHSMGMPFDRETISKGGLGGSESAAYYKAKELAARGHRVKLFTMAPTSEPDFIDNLWFLSAGQPTHQNPLGQDFEHYARNTPHDVLIIQRHPYAFHNPYAAKVCIFEHHDLALFRTGPQMYAGAWQVDAWTAVSEWHRKQIIDTYGINPESIHVVPNGVDAALYEEAHDGDDPFDGNSHNFRLIYQSRPERGLEHLVRPGGIMDRVQDLPVTLYVYGYENTTREMAQFYNQLKAWGGALPNVRFMGARPKPELARIQSWADLLLYPTAFEEVSCITAMEAMHAGLPILTSKVGALPETCEGSGTEFIRLLPKKDADDGEEVRVNEDAFVQKLRDYFSSGDASTHLYKQQQKQFEAAKSRTWTQSVDALEAVIDGAFANSRSLPAVLRSAIERSDIHFARWAIHTKAMPLVGKLDPITTSVMMEVDSMYAFTASDEAYAAHYLKHQTRYYDDHEDKVIGEDVTHTTRFRGARMLIGEHWASNDAKPLNILDYGCAHGHYSIPLAKELTNCQFFGMDVSERAVSAFNKWAKRDEMTNARAVRGIDPTIGSPGYDVILAGEVLEHVRDPWDLLAKFRAALNPGGLLVLTTPLGRWEHMGTKEFRTGREHLALFERRDLEDIFAGHDLRVLHAPASVDASGFPVGSYVLSVKFSAAPLGRIDYERKYWSYAPRQTISACMIVKNSEGSLQQAVESVVDWVDEVKIRIDPTTTDESEIVATDLAMRFPHRAFDVRIGNNSALKDGFDAARNESIEGAVGDWILWFDADEVVRHPARLHKLARPSMHNGYGFKQIHYSAEPAQVLTTDLPCRFFRNRQGAKFYGLVHEHPETEMGKAITYSIVRPEVEFLHGGYTDEKTRRERFYRNFPLVVKDKEKYPDRHLNRFLYLRDLAQGIMFEKEQMGGGGTAEHLERAQHAVDEYEKMVKDRSGYIGNRLLLDALPYYDFCVETLGKGFRADVDLGLSHEAAPDLGNKAKFNSRFHSVEFFRTFINSLLEESTKRYEAKHL